MRTSTHIGHITALSVAFAGDCETR